MKKTILLNLALVLVLLVLSACGGGGGAPTQQQGGAKTTASLTLNLTGSLPVNGAIAGAVFTLTLPANVTPALTNGSAANGVVSLSGIMTGSTISPLVDYVPATQQAPGTLTVTLASSAPAGLSQSGNIATVTLNLANGAEPTAGDFSVSGDSVADANPGGTGVIAGMGVGIAGVALQ